MNMPAPILIKTDPNAPIFKVLDRNSLVIKAGTIFAGHTFAEDTPVPLHLNAGGEPGYIPGVDYVVNFDGAVLSVTCPISIPEGETLLGGFHYAPGSNASTRCGGDNVPAINPFSLWDIAFRPTCPDPRGMVLVETSSGRFWCDIYLTGVNHLTDGTSKFGAVIADGSDLPHTVDGNKAARFDYATAQDVMAWHGKGLLSIDEFFAAAFGVTEKTAAPSDPKTTGLDAPHTSRFGLMQATGNLWVWGHDADPDQPRASIFGGSWLSGSNAGSRYAILDSWTAVSSGNLGARGRSDHLQPAEPPRQRRP